jgi:hypothetical protein
MNNKVLEYYANNLYGESLQTRIDDLWAKKPQMLEDLSAKIPNLFERMQDKIRTKQESKNSKVEMKQGYLSSAQASLVSEVADNQRMAKSEYASNIQLFRSTGKQKYQEKAIEKQSKYEAKAREKHQKYTVKIADLKSDLARIEDEHEQDILSIKIDYEQRIQQTQEDIRNIDLNINFKILTMRGAESARVEFVNSHHDKFWTVSTCFNGFSKYYLIPCLAGFKADENKATCYFMGEIHELVTFTRVQGLNSVSDGNELRDYNKFDYFVTKCSIAECSSIILNGVGMTTNNLGESWLGHGSIINQSIEYPEARVNYPHQIKDYGAGFLIR